MVFSNPVWVAVAAASPNLSALLTVSTVRLRLCVCLQIV
jgi:hypothetical protein